MTATSKLFKECTSNIPAEIRLETDWSFAISDKIAMILNEKGMSQKMFAQKMGKTETEISRWLSGTHNFTLRTIAKISVVLEVDLIQV